MFATVEFRLRSSRNLNEISNILLSIAKRTDGINWTL